MIYVKKEDHYVTTFMGTTYEIGKPENIGQLKGILEQIISDLPEDQNLEIIEVHVADGKIGYTLREGITQ